MSRLVLLTFILILGCYSLNAQHDHAHHWGHHHFTKADSLRGALRTERTCFDVHHYDLHIHFDFDKQYISGYVDMSYEMLTDSKLLQLDLFENMIIDSIVYQDHSLQYRRVANAVFIDASSMTAEADHTLRVHYQGCPKEAVDPPWDGGFSWDKDELDRLWLSVSCEGLGASSWWPNKDHLSDEPDSMDLHFHLPSGIDCVSNGRLITHDSKEEQQYYHYSIKHPINNYNVTFYVGQYAGFSMPYYGLDGDSMRLSYFVLDYNLSKALDHFKQVNGVLEAYEYYLGPYPFPKDGFKMVEAPYLGMEHQGAIAYGNKYMRGYLGGLIPRDQDWDYIIVHELGHEYFGNSISCSDHADMWIHESFTTYLEALYVEYHWGYEASLDHLEQERIFVNKDPIIGPKDVNFTEWDGSDHYFKGSWVLHTLRNVVNNDPLWFACLKALYEKFAYSVVSNEDIFDFLEDYLDKDLSLFFKQYLYTPDIPVLHIESLKLGNSKVSFEARWEQVIEGFNMPLVCSSIGEQQIVVTDQWQTFELDMSKKEFEIDLNNYLIIRQ